MPTIGDTRQYAGFGGLRIAFDGRVLRPRPWTTAQARWAGELVAAREQPRILELCAGAGQIGLLALASSGNDESRLVAVDANPVACEYLSENAGVAGLADRVDAREGQLEDVVRPEERFDLVIADPPWVEHDQVTKFAADPVDAIDGGPDGLDVAWACARVADEHLLPGGSLLLQLGSPDQAARLDARLIASGLSLYPVERRDFGVNGSLIQYTV